MSDSTTPTTNAQWAWKFLRLNSEYQDRYQEWREAHEDDKRKPLTEVNQAEILANLEKLGPWKRRYEPWVRAGLATGRQFIYKRAVELDHLDGSYIDAHLQFDPMAFLLTRWIDPNIESIEAAVSPFSEHGTLQLSVLDEHSDQFQAALALGVIEVFTPSEDLRKLVDGVDHLEVHELERPSWLDEGDERTLQIGVMRGWPAPPSVAEQALPEEDPRRQLDVLRRFWAESLGAPQAVRHTVFRITEPHGHRRMDGAFNIQFDLMQPLTQQIESAKAMLEEQQRALERVVGPYMPLLEAVRSSVSILPRYLALLEAYHGLAGEPEHGRKSRAIRLVLGDDSLVKGDSQYDQYAKNLQRAEFLRSAGYRTLAFL